MSQVSKLPFVDYSDPEYQENPFRWLADKARKLKLARSERGVEILDYQLCREFLIDRAFGTDHANLVEKMGLPDSRARDFKRRMLLTQNRGDTRKRIRNSLVQLIGPAQAGGLRRDIADVVSKLLDGISGSTINLKHDFADLVPAGVYCRWVDAPLSDARFVADSSEAVLAIFRRDPSLTKSIVAAYDRLFDYTKVQLEKRRADMGDDFLSRLIRIREAGGLSEYELEDFAVMLIEASTDNTAHQITIAVDRLTAMPDVWQAIGKDSSLAGAAVWETMRLWPRSISTSRVALIDTQLNGTPIPAGTTVFASFGAAHRQADIFQGPHRFDASRPQMPPHLNFGGGAFSCLGQFVANIEVEEAVAQLANRYPKMEVKKAEREYTPMFQIIPNLQVELEGR
ncbi:MAG: cytochrome P450 [Rhizobiaceae bacterium]|nr:cytochrome P450 [Rhizobiaceae bacterium]